MQTKRPDLIINGNVIRPGKQTTIFLPMPQLCDWTPMTMPVHVMHSKTPGPILCVLATVHGDEVNGIEVIRRLLKKSSIKKITGTLIAIPIVNIYGFLYQDRYLMDRRDLNRSFPGSPNGSLAARLAYLLTEEILSKATHIIDLHAGSLHRSNLPQIRTNIDNNESERLAISFNAPVILHAALRDGSIRQYASEKEIPLIVYEGGESLRFDELSIKTGVKGVLNVMRALAMLPELKSNKKKMESTISRSSYWVRAPISGILRPLKSLGNKIHEGELLAKIGNPTTIEEYDLVSPLSGIIIGKSNMPMAHEGAALFHIASFKELNLVAENIEYLQESFDETPDFFSQL